MECLQAAAFEHCRIRAFAKLLLLLVRFDLAKR